MSTTNLTYGITASDSDIALENVIKEIVYQKADQMMAGKNAIPVKGTPGLDYKFVIPTSWYLEAEEISEGARANVKNMPTFEVSGSLKKYQIPVFMNDEVKARQIANAQMQISLDAAAAGLAWKKDTEIFTALSAGAGSSAAATAAWDLPGADPASDIATAIGSILNGTTISDNEINSIGIFYPAIMFGHTSKPLQVGDVQESLRSWVKKEFNIGLYPTRQLTTTTLAIVNTPRMGCHYVHDGSAIPGAEQYREAGVGNGYLITQYFKTVLFPTTDGGTTTKYIAKITGVDA
jgi:hypothetical protein